MSLPADLARDTDPTRLAAGRYALDLPPHWDYLMPSGGVLMTVALRAIAAEIAQPEHTPRSATAIFCAPVPAGRICVEVQILRRGPVATQARAALSAQGGPAPGLEVSATFGREREGPSLGLVRAPAVPGPTDRGTVDALAEHRDVPRFLRNFECRRALGQPWWREDTWTPGQDRSGYWYRYRVPQVGPTGALDPFALPPLIDTMPPAMCQIAGPPAAAFIAPSLDLTVHWLEDTPREWLLTHAHCRRARAGYATGELEIWDDEGRLVAYGAQRMILRRRPPLPPVL